MYFKQDECPMAAMAEIQFCAAQGGDHRECCMRNGITTTIAGQKCLTFCDQRPGRVTPLDMSYIPCFDRFETIAVIFIIINPALWGILIAYSFWWYIDRKTPWKNGRPSQWVRSWIAWKYCADYFNCELIKTTDLPLDRNYVFAIHPHGVLGISTILNFVTEATNITEKFKLNFRIITLPINFRIPFHRDLELALGKKTGSRKKATVSLLGLISSDADSIEYALSKDTKGKATEKDL
uniref:diacylglycerol O-acyltransferase n=1 Tax=Panagrolaimus davidi TaxID=227884 RepID=A0A914R2I5_9BILA